jgi:hypothetical protein
MFDYEQALHATDVWPLMSKTQSVQEVISHLHNFKYTPLVENCELCSSDFGTNVKVATSYVEKDFGGLCLDCIKKPARKDVFKLYGTNNWDMGCRVKHNRTTWWYSWLASDQPAVPASMSKRDERRKGKNVARTRN